MDERTKSRTDLSVFLSKTPVSLMEEGTKQKQKSAQWRTNNITVGNVVHFEITCEYEGLRGVGQSNNKKQAKHKAALDYLFKTIDHGTFHDFFIPGSTREEARDNLTKFKHQIDSSSEDGASPVKKIILDVEEIVGYNIPPEDADKNWVGAIQELCQKHKIEVASYEDCDVPNDKKFHTICKVERQRTRGIASTKKVSKSIAAYLMYKTMEADIGKILSNDRVHFSEHSDDGEKSLREPKKIIQSADPVASLEMLLRDKAKFSTSKINYRILSRLSETESVQCLLEVEVFLPDEHSSTHENEERSKKRARDDGKFVFCGTSKNEEFAKQNAAENALLLFNTY